MTNVTETGRLRQVPDRYSSGWLDALDSRTSLAKDMRGRFAEIADDLGGLDGLSYAQRSLIERSLWLEFWMAEQERNLATGSEFEVGKWIQAANSLQGIYSKLGLQRQARDVPSLTEYLAKKEAAKEGGSE